jgi:glycerol-3-phosphate dehydrogenase
MANQSTFNNRLEQIDNNYQLVIVGGGIYGAALCWEAAHRGIKTLLVEQEDYACGASSNSLKTIHGGLRSLQSLNLNAVLKGIRERSIFLRIAPNYVKPLPCILPTSTSLMKSKPVVGMGLLLYNILSQLNIFTSTGDKKIPRTRLLSRDKFIDRAANINPEGITGGALWHDAQVTNTERMVWQFIRAAINRGATAINHASAIKHEYDSNANRHKITIRDQLSGDEKTVTASAVVDASAAWNFIKHCLPKSQHDEDLTFLKSVNIIVKKKIFDTAVGANIKADDNSSRLYFFAPWRDCTIIGTWYSSVTPYPENSFSQDEADTCINEINAAFRQPLLNTVDICNVHIGFLPATKNQHSDALTLDRNLISRYQFKDWSQQPGMQNIYSLRGTKYTLARHDAQQVVDQLAKTMQWKVTASRSDQLPIYLPMSAVPDKHSLSGDVISQLLVNYGAETEGLLERIINNPQSAELIPGTQHHITAEIHHAVLNEQALTLSDLLKRRLAIGDRAPPDLVTAQHCAQVMQQLLSWSDETLHTQISELYASYPAFLLKQNNTGAQQA